MKVEKILEDLYLLDPALRSEEAELKKIIKKMLDQKPEAEADPGFREELKAELIARMEEKKKRAGFFVVHRKAVVGAAGIAAAVIVVLTFALRPGLISGVMSPDRMMASEEVYNYGSVSETESAILKSDKQKEAPVEQAAVIKPSSAVPDMIASDEAVPKLEMKRLAESPSVAETGMAMLFEEDLMMDSADSEVLTVNEFAGEEYRALSENPFIAAAEEPLSTFSIDVDTASYANVRRFINSGMLPNPDAVRIEELVNYFSYDYPQPAAELPFSFTTELSECPWNEDHLLLHIGLQAYEVPASELPPTNIVFLIDSSGSMMDENKLPLLKDSMSLLIDTLRPEDRVSIVAYAGSAGLVLPPTAGNNKPEIFRAIEDIDAGGSTAGGAGIELAYKTAAANLFKGGNNRVIIATDGDFNVGQSSEEELKGLIEQYRDQGIYLTVLGLGMGNYKDARMETLADNGNGNYAYIDTINEANKVLVTEMSSTILTIAKDVKIQIDFNPAVVESYRLIGYENRVMAAEDFDNDRKDAGEIGAGHSVTALYEIIPATNVSSEQPLAGIEFRYKKPDQQQSLLVKSLIDNEFILLDDSSDNFRFSAAVVEWGLILRSSEYMGTADIEDVIRLAKGSVDQDPYGYRKEFLGLLHQTVDLLK